MGLREWLGGTLLLLAASGAAAQAITKPAPWTETGTRTATAFAINERDLLTNSHAVSDCRRIKLSSSGAVADVVASDPSLDLAVLRSSARFNASAVFRLRAAQLGEEVVVAGYPLKGLLSDGLQITTGLVSARAGLLNDPSSFQTSAQIQPGSSGGPVFAKSGLVIGVVVRMLDDLAVSKYTGTLPQNVNFAIHAGAVRQFLRSHSIPFAEQAPVQKRSAEQIAKGADAFTVALECLN